MSKLQINKAIVDDTKIDSLRLAPNIRLLWKLASDSQVLRAYGTEDRSVLDIHEDLSTRATTQLAAEVEFSERSIESLVHKGNIDALDDNRLTPLHIAVMQQKFEIVQALLKNGAEPSIKAQGTISIPGYKMGMLNPTPLELAIAISASPNILLKCHLDVTKMSEDDQKRWCCYILEQWTKLDSDVNKNNLISKIKAILEKLDNDDTLVAYIALAEIFEIKIKEHNKDIAQQKIEKIFYKLLYEKDGERLFNNIYNFALVSDVKINQLALLQHCIVNAKNEVVQCILEQACPSELLNYKRHCHLDKAEEKSHKVTPSFTTTIGSNLMDIAFKFENIEAAYQLSKFGIIHNIDRKNFIIESYWYYKQLEHAVNIANKPNCIAALQKLYKYYKGSNMWIELMLKRYRNKIVELLDNEDKVYINTVFNLAIRHQDNVIAKMLVEKGATYKDYGLKQAIEKGDANEYIKILAELYRQATGLTSWRNFIFDNVGYKLFDVLKTEDHLNQAMKLALKYDDYNTIYQLSTKVNINPYAKEVDRCFSKETESAQSFNPCEYLIGAIKSKSPKKCYEAVSYMYHATHRIELIKWRAVFIRHYAQDIINIIKKDGNYLHELLHSAIKYNDFQMIDMLIERSLISNVELSIEKLFDGKADIRKINLIHWAAIKGNNNLIKLLLEQKVSVAEEDHHGWNALHYAASEGHVHTVDFILSLIKARGISADIKTTNAMKETALHIAACFNHKNVCEVLLSRGACINSKNAHGSTALHIASAIGILDIVQYLVGKGAAIDIKNNSSKTPLNYAESSNEYGILNFMESELKKRKAAQQSSMPTTFVTSQATYPNTNVVHPITAEKVDDDICIAS
jgi:ankyrin repeat protein